MGSPQIAEDIRRVRPPAQERAAMADEVRAGLEARPLPFLPSKYFYDERGGALFDEITRLPEYYLTRTEEALLPAVAREAVARVRPRNLVELGSGVGGKVRVLLDAMEEAGTLESCTLLDISESAIANSLSQLRSERPRLKASGVVGDFLTDLRAVGPGESRLIAFLGSTIGNIHPQDVPAFFRSAAAILAPGDAVLVGLDLVKDRARLEAAYNDARGVTAEFNRNILQVMNARLGADFDPAAFDHVAFYDPDHAWIEMRLRARRALDVRVPGAATALSLPAGGEIRTEISCKYTRAALEAALSGTGLMLNEWRTDPESLFALALLRRLGRS
ncbi:MAG: L-histidine N(alpha)-methyltransferase [Acidobacteria bacterium]|nr:MAG: L-histidine N(alpha)-methyltransferase [Acidobacteriota bacterium]